MYHSKIELVKEQIVLGVDKKPQIKSVTYEGVELVEGVDYISDGENYVLSGNNIVPYALGGPFEKYTITNLSGAITDTEMTLSFMCGEYPVTYVGSR